MLINCVAYQEGKKLSDIPVEDISDYLDKPDCFVWVALRDATADEMAQMQEEFNLHELAVEDAARGHQRPKVEEYGDCLFTVVHTVDLDHDGLVTGELAIFAGPNYVLSVRRDAAKGFLGVRARAEREPHLLQMGSSFVMYALMDAVVDRYFPVVDMLESELETIEDRIFTHGAQRNNVERLYQLKRKALELRHAVTPLMDAVGRLLGGRAPTLAAGVQDYFRDVHDHLIRPARHHPRHHRHRDPGQPVDGVDRRERSEQAPGRLGRDLRRVHRLCRRVGHELQVHARAGVEVRLSDGDRGDGGCLPLFIPFIQEIRLALKRPT
jgi:magnesium transporter